MKRIRKAEKATSKKHLCRLFGRFIWKLQPKGLIFRIFLTSRLDTVLGTSASFRIGRYLHRHNTITNGVSRNGL